MKWTSEFVGLFEDSKKYKRKLKISNILDKNDMPNGSPFFQGTKLRCVTDKDFRYTEDEIDFKLKLAKDSMMYFHGIFKVRNGNNNLTLRTDQKKFIEMLYNNRFNMLVTARQFGTSTLMDFFIILNILEGRSVSLFTIYGDRVEKILKKISLMPYYLQPVLRHFDDSIIEFRTDASIRINDINNLLDVCIIDDMAYINDENSIYDRVLSHCIPTTASMSVISTPQMGSYFNEIYQKKSPLFAHKKFAMIPKFNHKSGLSRYSYEQEYNCVMDEKLLKKYKRQDQIGKITGDP